MGLLQGLVVRFLLGVRSSGGQGGVHQRLDQRVVADVGTVRAGKTPHQLGGYIILVLVGAHQILAGDLAPVLPVFDGRFLAHIDLAVEAQVGAPVVADELHNLEHLGHGGARFPGPHIPLVAAAGHHRVFEVGYGLKGAAVRVGRLGNIVARLGEQAAGFRRVKGERIQAGVGPIADAGRRSRGGAGNVEHIGAAYQFLDGFLVNGVVQRVANPLVLAHQRSPHGVANVIAIVVLFAAPVVAQILGRIHAAIPGVDPDDGGFRAKAEL